MMIVMIGAGNLATNLGKALVKEGYEVGQVYSRTEASASALAEVLGCGFTTNLADVRNDADLYVVSLKDSALADLSDQITKGREHALFVHTAGSMPMDTLGCERRGVLYPMQTFSKTKEVDFKEIPIFIEANSSDDLMTIKQLSQALSNSVYELSSAERRYLHLSAVFCCNFANHCFALGEKLLQDHGGIPFSVMLPLIDETSRKLHSMSPKEGQTGPAVRWDENVINKQIGLLKDDPQLQEIYRLMSHSIHEL